MAKLPDIVMPERQIHGPDRAFDCQRSGSVSEGQPHAGQTADSLRKPAGYDDWA